MACDLIVSSNVATGVLGAMRSPGEHRAPQPLPPSAPALAVHESALLRTRFPRSWPAHLPPIAVLHFLQRRLRLLVSRLRHRNFFRAEAALQLVQLVSRVFFRCKRYFPICFGGVALLLGDEILFGERVIALKIQMRACLVGCCAVEIAWAASMFLYG